jgi:hypothetical protein
MTKRTFLAIVQDGKAHLTAPVAYRQFLQQFDNGDELDVVLQPHRRTRTNPQNRYYWGVVVKLLAEHCGYEPDEMHEALKARFLGANDPQFGLLKIGSTRKLTTVEFGVFLEQCQQLGAEMGVYIPNPNDVDLESLPEVA